MTGSAAPASGPGRGLALLVGYVLLTGLLAGMLSPLVLRALHGVGVEQATLDEVTLRTLELVAIAATVPLLALLGCRGPRAWGVPPRRHLIARLGAGLALGILSLGLVCAALFVLEVRAVRVDLVWDPGYWARVVAGAALSAAAVAVLEEFWFRGGLFTALWRVGGAATALWAGAAVYAAAHFMEAAHGYQPEGAWSGYSMLAHLTVRVFDPQNLDSFAALLAAGITLGLVRLRHGDVALCIGIHAGWVFTIKVFKKLTHLSPDSGLRGVAGHYDDVIGWLAAAVLALMALTLWWRLPAAGEELRP